MIRGYGVDLGYPVFLEQVIDVDGYPFVYADDRDGNLFGGVEVYGGEALLDEIT